MSTIVIAGRVGKDAEIRETKAGPVLGFSVAESTYENGEKGTRWWDVSYFRNADTLQKLARNISKGDPISVPGEFGTREHNGKTYFKVRADRIDLQGSKKPNESSAYDAAPAVDGHDPLPF